jgi:hypothetical protein
MLQVRKGISINNHLTYRHHCHSTISPVKHSKLPAFIELRPNATYLGKSLLVIANPKR